MLVNLQMAWQAPMGLFSDNDVIATEEILERFGITGGGVCGVVQFIKKLSGKPIEKSQITETNEKGDVNINLGDGKVLENVNIENVNMYNDKNVRRKAHSNLDVFSKNWSFLLGDTSINIDISETTIAQDVMEHRRGISVDDIYKVTLEEIEYPPHTQGRLK